MMLKPSTSGTPLIGLEIHSVSRRTYRFCDEGYGVNPAGATGSADLGCSSEYSLVRVKTEVEKVSL